mmetsp:Transcript_62335/g.103667  ORF Transcript_62335/g.103667 Transcript_62335/m.103667 type:complete len:238 (+) Transcript_62335:54-767(+)
MVKRVPVTGSTLGGMTYVSEIDMCHITSNRTFSLANTVMQPSSSPSSSSFVTPAEYRAHFEPPPPPVALPTSELVVPLPITRPRSLLSALEDCRVDPDPVCCLGGYSACSSPDSIMLATRARLPACVAPPHSAATLAAPPPSTRGCALVSPLELPWPLYSLLAGLRCCAARPAHLPSGTQVMKRPSASTGSLSTPSTLMETWCSMWCSAGNAASGDGAYFAHLDAAGAIPTCPALHM